MSYDGSGNYSLPPGYFVSNGDVIVPGQHNPIFQDVAAALSQVLLRSGVAPMTGNITMSGNKITGLANGTNDTDAATVGQAALQIGDFKGSYRTLDSSFLRRDGSLYLISSYPTLAALLPALPDGVTWSNVTTSIGENTSCFSLIDNDFYIVTIVGTTAKVYKSTDKVNWNNVATIAGFSQVSEISKLNGIFTICGTDGSNNVKVASSSDGLTWGSATSVSTMIGSGGICSLAFGSSLYVISGGQGAIYTSPDLSTWTSRTSGFTGSDAIYRVRFVNSVFVACGSSGKVSTSTNGTTWTTRTTGVSASLYDAIFATGLYTIVGANGTIITSSALTSWTTRTSGTTAELHSITYSTSGYLTVGNGGVGRLSTDAINWTAIPVTTAVNLWEVHFDPNAQNIYYASPNITGSSGLLLKGTRTLPTQFQIPNDGPYQWVKAL